MKLNEIADRPGARQKRMRIGRGIGSGKGKTGGRGGKGQTARAGVSIKGFEGGQMPLHRRLPKRGFNNIFALDLNEVNIGRVQEAIDKGKLTADAIVNVETLVNAGILSRARDGVRLLGGGEIKAKLQFEVWGASRSAVAAVEKQGGTVKILAPQKPQKEAGEGAS
jgi:large subunit ribosomal protein L15